MFPRCAGRLKTVLLSAPQFLGKTRKCSCLKGQNQFCTGKKDVPFSCVMKSRITHSVDSFRVTEIPAAMKLNIMQNTYPALDLI